jgi:hypothetical protein
VGNGVPADGSDRGAENGEGDRSDGSAAFNSGGRALVVDGKLVDGKALPVDIFDGNGVGRGDPLGRGDPGSVGEAPSDGKLGPAPKPGGSASVAGGFSFCCWL